VIRLQNPLLSSSHQPQVQGRGGSAKSGSLTRSVAKHYMQTLSVSEQRRKSVFSGSGVLDGVRESGNPRGTVSTVRRGPNLQQCLVSKYGESVNLRQRATFVKNGVGWLVHKPACAPISALAGTLSTVCLIWSSQQPSKTARTEQLSTTAWNQSI